MSVVVVFFRLDLCQALEFDSLKYRVQICSALSQVDDFSLVHNIHADVAVDAGIEMNPIPASASTSKDATDVEAVSLKFDAQLGVGVIL